MIPQSAIQKFRESLRGQLFCPGDPGYNDDRSIPNAMIEPAPGHYRQVRGCGGV
jgi:hypothetical protein